MAQWCKHPARAQSVGRKEGNVLFNDTLNTFYLQLYGFKYMVKDHSDSERKTGQSNMGSRQPVTEVVLTMCDVQHYVY